ncbi:unnamed protein product, partial [Rotaria sp. Silwood1]
VDKTIIYGDTDQLSEYPDEHGVLFDLNACFEIESIGENKSLSIIKMNLSNEGRKITKDFIELKQKQTKKIMHPLFLEDYYRAWIEYNIDRVLALKEEWKKKTREYEDRAYDQMMNNKSARTKDSAHVLNNIGLILYRQGKFDETIDCHQRALKIREKLYPFVHADMAKSLGNIGNILSDQRKYNEALDNHQHALKIEEKFHPFGHVDIAHIIDL